MPEDAVEQPKVPTVFANYTSFIGVAIAGAALLSIILLFLIEITGSSENPYHGILTYIMFPAVLIIGISVAVLGAILERRRRRRSPDWKVAPYPRLDLNDPKAR